MDFVYGLLILVVILLPSSYVMARLWMRIYTAGTLRIDHSNPGKDTYRFEIDDLNTLGKSKRIVLKVDNNADLSQK